MREGCERAVGACSGICEWGVDEEGREERVGVWERDEVYVGHNGVGRDCGASRYFDVKDGAGDVAGDVLDLGEKEEVGQG